MRQLLPAPRVDWGGLLYPPSYRIRHLPWSLVRRLAARPETKEDEPDSRKHQTQLSFVSR